MSEERFDRIEQRQDRLETGQEALRVDMNGRFDKVDQRFAAIDRRFEAVDARFDKVDQRFEDLDRHMHVLYEDTISRIAAIREFNGPSKSEFEQGLANLAERIGRELDPLKAIARQHSEQLRRHSAKIEGLEKAQGH